MSSRLVGSNTLFLHIPKTGGTWIEYALKNGGVKLRQALIVSGATFRHPILLNHEEKFKHSFSFVRHPLKWYESYWKFQAGIWNDHEAGVWHPQRILKPCWSDDFSEFIRLCIKHEPGYVTRMYEWYIGPPGQQLVDHVGKFENLVEDLIKILKAIGQPFNEVGLRGQERVNESRNLRGKPVWDPELREQMLVLEAPAIRRFYPDEAEPSPPYSSDRIPDRARPFPFMRHMPKKVFRRLRHVLRSQ